MWMWDATGYFPRVPEDIVLLENRLYDPAIDGPLWLHVDIPKDTTLDTFNIGKALDDNFVSFVALDAASTPPSSASPSPLVIDSCNVSY